MHLSLLNLFKTKRFFPLFITQFLGAFNDNFFKNALIILIAYQLEQDAVHANNLIAIAGGIFIFPFFIFSAIAGQFADKYDKAVLMRWIKVVEIFTMLFATIGFVQHRLDLLMLSLFLLGTHSAFFGPAKYAVLPQHLNKNELMRGNALIEASTFIAILMGTVGGGVFISFSHGTYIVSIIAILCAVFGFIGSLWIPHAPSANTTLKITANFLKETWHLIQIAQNNRKIFLIILGISWFWFIGAAFLTQFPSFAKEILRTESSIVTVFLALFSVGIAVGSLLAGRLQKTEASVKYVPLGIVGMSVFIVDLFFASHRLSYLANFDLQTLSVFLKHFTHWRIMFDILAIAICGGIYIVPLYTLLQIVTDDSSRARMIAVNNILNALFMVFAAFGIIVLNVLHFSISQVFLVIGILNLFVAFYVGKLLPFEIAQSFVAWILKILFRVKVKGLKNYPLNKQPLIIVANHVSFLDGLLLVAFLPDKFLLAINTQIASRAWVKILTGLVKIFPIDPINSIAIKHLIKAVRSGERCLIFPEGRITKTGALMKIYEGPGLIADKTSADIIRVRIDGAQYSVFSRLKGKAKLKWFPKITLTILPPHKFEISTNLKGRARRQFISSKFHDFMKSLMFESSDYQKTLLQSLYEAKKTYGAKHNILEDVRRNPINYSQFILKCMVLGSCMKQHFAAKEKIGLLLPNSIVASVCFFAIHTIDCIPVMLNFSVGQQLMFIMIKIAKLKVVYTSRQFVQAAKLEETIDAFIQNNIQIIYVEDLAQKISLKNKIEGWLRSQISIHIFHDKKEKAKSKLPAVILFTSGSEGTPKGVVLSHQNIQANRFQLVASIDFNNNDIVFNSMPVFHSFGLTAGLLMPLLSGIKVFLYPSPLHYRIIPELIYDVDATILFGTDTFLAGYAKFASPYDFYSVRYAFAGAEKLKLETRKTWQEKFGVRIFEGYGTTETSPILSMNTPLQNKINTVGTFVPKVEYKLETVAGVENGGRLWVKGPNVMLGYLTLDKPDELITPSEGWHDTGDIVEINEAGYITIAGRAKRFAKIGGEMVSLQAVENYVYQIWSNFIHAIISVPDPKKGEKLVLVTNYPEANREILRAYLNANHIGEIYLPKLILYLAHMPLLGVGKVDYSKLKAYVEKQIIENS